jgi:hypothetical protein
MLPGNPRAAQPTPAADRRTTTSDALTLEGRLFGEQPMKKALPLSLCVMMAGSTATLAQGSGQFAGVSQCWNGREFVTVKGNCPTTSSASTSSGNTSRASSSFNANPAVYSGAYSAGYQLGYAFGRWLFGTGSNPQAQLQKQLMMAELQRRQAEAERQHREEEARRLAAMYNRLAATLKLSGLPNLQLKEMASSSPGLKLKLGDSADGQAGVKGLPGIYLNDGKVPYGVPGLPGIYTGGPGQASGLSNSKLALKTGENAASTLAANAAAVPAGPNASGQPSAVANEPGLQLKTGESNVTPAAQASMIDPEKMTPQQLADLAELVSKLPPEEQQGLLAAAQTEAPSGQPVPGMIGQPAAQSLVPLQQQTAASQSGAAAPLLEDASARARAGFDTAMGPSGTQPVEGLTSGQARSASLQIPVLAATVNLPIGTSQSSPSPAVAAKAPESASAQPASISPGESALRAKIIADMNAVAKKLGWSASKQASLNEALNRLDFDGDPNPTKTQVMRTWQDVLARDLDPALAQMASQQGGLGFPGAGTQTAYQDCAVFALANAAGLPYGVVAARATELIRQGNWRAATDRADPQTAIERGGLTGGEVIMLAESFGQAEVVPSSDFVKTLNAGRTVMINVVPGHEVVLTNTFQHGGETWFVMMDSNQGPQRRLFLTSKELNTILLEKGVAFRPEPGTTPTLLRAGDQ